MQRHWDYSSYHLKGLQHLGLLGPEDEGTIISWNVNNYNSSDTASHPRILESLWENHGDDSSYNMWPQWSGQNVWPLQLTYFISNSQEN